MKIELESDEDRIMILEVRIQISIRKSRTERIERIIFSLLYVRH
jgi:hypothetical protein